MKLRSRKWRWLALVLVLMAVAFGVIRTWVVPAVMVGQIEKHYKGKVVIKDWWFGLESSGISGLELHESMDPKSPSWLTADRITTDVSLGRLLHGQAMPSKVVIDRPKVAFQLDAKGQPTTKIPLAPPEPGANPKAATFTLPEIDTKDAEVTLQQEGRKPMTITGIAAKLKPDADGESIDVTTNDPTWGQVKLTGHFDKSFKNGKLQINSSPGFVATPDKIERIPFIPPEVWANIEPNGPVDAKVMIDLALESAKPVKVHTELDLRGTSAKLPTAQVTATDATGHVVIDDATVTITNLRGKALDGTIAASGTLDFAKAPPRFDLDVRLKGIDVTKAPPSWQLGELNATGKMTGKIDLRVNLAPSGIDLTGTSGEAVIEDGSFRGIPIKSLSVGMNAEGRDLQYAAVPGGSTDKAALEANPTVPPTDRPRPAAAGSSGSMLRAELWEPVYEAIPLVRMATHDSGPLGWAAYAASEVIAYRSKHPAATATATAGKVGGFRLPKSVTSQIELEDVDVKTILEKAEKFGIKVPVPIAGRFSIKATATIPLGSLTDIKGYGFHGDASLAAASIDNVDLGRVTAHLDLADGILDLSDFRGQFVNQPDGSIEKTPPPTALPPKEGALPVGGFRASLKAHVSPRGVATAKIEGNRLPLGEIFAPVLPVPTPLSGELSINVTAAADLGTLADPTTYTLDGQVESHRIAYQGAVVDEVATEIHVKHARLDVSRLEARLVGKPLSVKGGVDLAPPYRYGGTVKVEGWEIADVLNLIPGAPKPAPASGTIDAVGEANGAIEPFAIQTKGSVRVLRAKAGPVPLGSVVFQWVTDRDSIAISGLEATTSGGKITGEARIPTKPGVPVEAMATLKGIDANKLAGPFLGPKLSIAGRADGRIKLKVPLDASSIDAEAHITSPDMTVRQGYGEGIRVGEIRINAKTLANVIGYDATASTLGAKLRFKGSMPVGGDLAASLADAEIQVAPVRIADAWRGLGMSGGVALLDGEASIAANLRASVAPVKLWSRGIVDLQGLKYGNHLALGNLRGTFALTPSAWRIDNLNGDLLGGVAEGGARSESTPGGSRRIAFDFKVDRASLGKMMLAVPSMARDAEGYGSLVVAGRFDEALHATTEVLVPRAVVFKLPLSDLRFPGEVELNPANGMGSFHSRHWTARLAGGSVQGNTFLRLGEDKSFHAEVKLDNVDLELVSRLESIGKKPASGKLSGKVTLNGPNPGNIGKYRGRIDLDLDDASLVELPVVRELDRFLGAARGGGLFEDGDIHGTIYNKTLFIEQATLQGRLVQVHATGTVTFDGGLNLEILINTNDTIPQSGMALVNLIPGLSEVLNRSEQALARLSSFLSNKLLKLRVSGTIKNPNVALDAGVGVGNDAVGFFSNVLKVPLGGARDR